MLDVNLLRQERAKLLEALRQKHDAASDNGGATDSEEAEMRKLETSIETIETSLAREEGLQGRENGLGKSTSPFAGSARWQTFRGSAKSVEYTNAILSPSQSVREYMQERGQIKQPEYEHLSLGGFCRAMVTGARSDLERRALGEASDSTGGYTVPDITLTRFVDKMRAATVVVRAGAQTVPITSDSTTIARTATDPAASWRVENAAVNVADPTFEGVVFQPRSLAVIVRVSRELLEDSLNIEAMLEASFAGSMAVELDRVALVGSGIAPEPQGIYGTANVGSVTTVGKPADYTKFTAGLYELWVDNEMTVTGMVMHPRTLQTLSDMVTGLTSDKTPLRPPDVVAAIPQFITTSIPINLGGGSNESLVIMGNFARLLIGVRSALRIEVLRELYMGNMQYGICAYLRADVAVEHPESFCVLSGVTA